MSSDCRIDLQPHPASMPGPVQHLRAAYWLRRDGWRLRYELSGDIAALRLPAFAGICRGEQLWERSCFELFVTVAGGGYREFNLAPDGAWAAYDFSAYREASGRPEGKLLTQVAVAPGRDRYVIDFRLAAEAAPAAPLALGLATVIEATDGRRYWWALAHPPGPPDFHHRDNFCIALT